MTFLRLDQMLEDMRGPIPFQMLAYAYREVSGCFPDKTAGITTYTCKFIHDTRTELRRNRIFRTERVGDLK